MDPTFPLVPIANALACVLILIPLIHLLSGPWNTGVCMFGIWVFLVGVATCVNTSLFSDNVNDKAPIWCDIGERYFYGASDVLDAVLTLACSDSPEHLLSSCGSCMWTRDHPASLQNRPA